MPRGPEAVEHGGNLGKVVEDEAGRQDREVVDGEELHDATLEGLERRAEGGRQPRRRLRRRRPPAGGLAGGGAVLNHGRAGACRRRLVWATDNNNSRLGAPMGGACSSRSKN
jgi:hypothetical protein